MGLFHKHRWKPLGAFFSYKPTDYTITSMMRVTNLSLFCPCGKTTAKHIANWKMTDHQIKTYVTEVYGEIEYFQDVND